MQKASFAFLVVCWSHASTTLVTADALRSIRFASPLQSLTIWDPEVKEETENRRFKFLDKYASGLKAEVEARKKLGESQEPWLETSTATSSKSSAKGNWAKQAAAKERSKFRAEEEYVEHAFDEAIAKFSLSSKSSSKQRQQPKANPNQYQFVGVVNSPLKSSSSRSTSSSKTAPITWYARKKPPNAKWSVRLVHANRNAIIKDLFNRGKVDIFARYENTGKVDPETNTPIIQSKYSVANRSWRNLWNFSPKHLLTDSSGMYWRERRVSPGLYTDGKTVYEASYRYRDGRNGMHRISSFQQYLASKGVDAAQKERILKRLASDVPDVVVEND